MNARWLAGKLGAALLTLVFVLIFNFFLFRGIGDPTAELARLPQSTPEEVEKLRASYGLDKPLLGQFTDYAGDTLTFDLGISQDTREPVWDEIKEAIPWTLLLVGTGTLLATVIGAWLGVVAATKRGKTDRRGLTQLQPVHVLGSRVLDRDPADPGVRRGDPDIPGGPAGDARGRTSRPGSPRRPTSPTTWCCRRRR